VRVLVAGPDRDDVLQVGRELAAGLESVAGDLLGPAELFRVRGRHRAQLVVKTDRPREVASRAAKLLAAGAPAMREADLSAVVDVDPQSV
jgi:primosomal protein N'